MAVFHELQQVLWLETPRGQGRVLFVIDSGPESDLEWVCAHQNGEIWSWLNYDVRVCVNITFGRREISMPKMTHRQFERSGIDKAKDRREAKKRGVSVGAYEGSAADRKADAAALRKINKRKK